MVGIGGTAAGVVSWALGGGTASIALTVVSLVVFGVIKLVLKFRIYELEREQERPADAPEDEREQPADAPTDEPDPGSWWTGADL